MKRYGIIGRPLTHSASPALFAQRFQREGLSDHRYDRFELEQVEDLTGLIQGTPGLAGLNVTLPFKRSVIPLLDQLDATAAAVGAVNTIDIRGGRTTGHNTDVAGFRAVLEPLLPHLVRPGSDLRPRALVLGSGGASRAVAYVLRELGIRFRVVSRSRERGDITWDLVDRTVVGVCPLLINTTPLGMHPLRDASPPLPYEAIGPRHVLIDLVYEPAETLFLAEGRQRGARVVNGMGMLVAQADAAWAIWNRP